MSDANDHKEKMQALQAEQRKKTREATDPERALVLVHTGNGKGKSSSAFGVITRALGWGKSVGVVQFIKGKWVTGERKFFERFPEELTWRTMGDGFTWDTQDREQDTVAARAAFQVALDSEILVLDDLGEVVVYTEETIGKNVSESFSFFDNDNDGLIDEAIGKSFD